MINRFVRNAELDAAADERAERASDLHEAREAATAPDHLTVDVSPRDFVLLPAIPSEYGGEIKVYESSAALAPHVWLSATDTNTGPGGQPVEACIHLTAENAWKLAEQLMSLVQNHYQGDARPEVRTYDQVVAPVEKTRPAGSGLFANHRPEDFHAPGVPIDAATLFPSAHKHAGVPTKPDWPTCTCGYSNDDDPRTDHHPNCRISRL